MTRFEVVLPHQARFLEEISLALEEIQDDSDSVGIVLAGDSGAGKTYSVDLAVAQFEAQVRLVRDQIDIKNNAVEHHLANVLERLGRPPTPKDMDRGLGKLARRVLADMDVRLVFLEEAHNGLVKSEKKFRGQMGEHLKNFWNAPPDEEVNWAGAAPGKNAHKKVIVLTGTDELLDALDQDAQLRSRFNRVVHASCPALFPDDEGQRFRRIVRSIAERHSIRDIVDVNDAAVISYVYAVTNRNLRELNSLLRRVKTLRRKTPEATVLDLLREASPTPLTSEQVDELLPRFQLEAALPGSTSRRASVRTRKRRT